MGTNGDALPPEQQAVHLAGPEAPVSASRARPGA